MSLLYHKDELMDLHFEASDLDSWKQQVLSDLGSKDLDKFLLGKVVDGICMYPFHVEVKNQAEFLNLSQNRTNTYIPNSWKYQEFIALSKRSQEKKANQVAIRYIEEGVDSILFDCTNVDFQINVAALLKNIDVSATSISWKLGKKTPLKKLYFPNTLACALYLNPLEYFLKHGSDWKQGMEDISILLKREDLELIKTLAISGMLFTESGASVIQEVGLCCSLIVEYLDQLTEKGHQAQLLFENLELSLGTRTAYLIDIAKYRALQILLIQLADAYHVKLHQSIPLRAVSSNYNKSAYDVHANILRNTSEGMAAILGGCNTLHFCPHDLQENVPHAFSNRIARNVSHILKYEAHMDIVSNPVDGAYALENLTHQIVEEGWAYFLALEKEGGLLKAFEKGIVQEDIARSADHKVLVISTLQSVIVGSNRYIDIALKKTEYSEKLPDSNNHQLLRELRACSIIESIRAEVDRVVAKGNDRPNLAILVADDDTQTATVNARVSFVQDILHSIGIDSTFISRSIQALYHEDLAIAEYDAIVIVGDDHAYTNIDAEALKQINSIYALPCLVAGLPRQLVDKQQEYGIFAFIYKGMQIPEFAHSFLKRINFM